jgi:hypothetical protein
MWKRKFPWGGPGYNLGQNLFSANRGAWDADPVPGNTFRFPYLAEWGYRESDRRALGYFTPSYDPAHTPEMKLPTALITTRPPAFSTIHSSRL